MFCCSSREDNKEARHRPEPSNVNVPQQRPSSQQAPSGKPVGVGIVFQPDSTGALHVKSLAVGGPAEKSGEIMVGDVLHEIDNHQCYRKPVAQLAPLILGQEGTMVRLGVHRGNLQRLIYVELRRGWSMPPPQLPQGARLSHFSGLDGQMSRDQGPQQDS